MGHSFESGIESCAAGPGSRAMAKSAMGFLRDEGGLASDQAFSAGPDLCEIRSPHRSLSNIADNGGKLVVAVHRPAGLLINQSNRYESDFNSVGATSGDCCKVR